MDRAREHVLADAALALEQDREVGAGAFSRMAEQVAHDRRDADRVAEAMLVLSGSASDSASSFSAIAVEPTVITLSAARTTSCDAKRADPRAVLASITHADAVRLRARSSACSRDTAGSATRRSAPAPLPITKLGVATFTE